MWGFKKISNARSVQMNLGCKFKYISLFVRAVRLFVCSFVRSFVGLFVCLRSFVFAFSLELCESSRRKPG